MKKLQSILMAMVMLLTVMSLLAVPALAEDSVNLITNGDFESTEGWTISETHAVSADAGKSGQGLMIDYATAGTSITYTGVSGLEAGKSYILSFDVKVLTAIEGYGMRYVMREGAAGALVGGIASFVTGAAGDWTTVEVTFTVADFQSAMPVQMQFYFMDPTTAGKVYIDNVSVTEKQLAAAKTGNLVSNSDLENETNSEWAFLNSAEIVTLTEGEGDDAVSNKAIKLTLTEDQPWAYQSLTGFKANTTYTVSYAVKTDADSVLTSAGSEGGIRSRIDLGVRAGGAQYYPTYTTNLASDAWRRMGTSFTTSASVTTETVLVLSLYAMNATGIVYIDDVVVEELASADSDNLVSNASFEIMYTNGLPQGWLDGAGTATPGTVLFMDNTDAYDGNWSAKLDGNTDRLTLMQDITVEAGKTYRISYAAKVANVATPMFLRHNPDGVSGAAAPGFLNWGVTLPAANEWYEVVTYFRPTTGGKARLMIGTYNGTRGGAFWLDAFCVKEVTEGTVDFVNPDKNVNELRVIAKPTAGSNAVAFAALPNPTDTASLVTAVYVQKDGALRLNNVSISSTVYSGANGITDNTAALLVTEGITVPADAYLVKTFIWSADGITPIGESKVVSLAQTAAAE